VWQDVLGLLRALFTTAEVSRSTCLEKQHLCNRLTELRRANIALHIEALAAVLEGVPIDITLHVENVREMRKLIMERLHNHIVEHGC
jgi:hypothetical protein